MFRTKLLTRTVTVVAVFVLALGSVQPAYADPPANDDFDFATIIPGLAFSDSTTTVEATTAFDDPTTCTNNGSVWYAFTPGSDMAIEANTFGSDYDTVLSVYTGTRGDLTQVPGGCNDDYSGLQSRVVFSATSGTTYYFLIGTCCGFGGTGGGSLTFAVQEHVLQPPVVNFGLSPSDPSIFDNIQYYDGSYDPEYIGLQSFEWDFGDGATSTDQYPTHQYATDGDYTVNLTATTVDGRTASASQVVQVRTHDVAITKISAPQSANSGQARKILVEVKNRRYPEYVQVELYKSVSGGFQWVGSYTQYVPVRSGNQTSTFTFNYTFTKEDASQGKVTFKAVATIGNFRDAWPADNELISSPPTKVTR